MDNALYITASRQATLQRSLDVVANNLANLDTAGFKVEQLIVNTDPQSPQGVVGAEPLKYVIDNGIARNFGQGALEQTGVKTDVGIQGDAFFTVQTANGPRYTRDGRFAIDTQGRLTTKAGDPVQGAGGDITLDPQKGPPAIGKDGTITQTDASGVTSKAGKLTVVRFADLSALSKEGDNLYQAAGGQTPLPAPDATMAQGAVERSNVQAVIEMTQLVAISRAYERMNAIVTQNQSLSESAVQRLGKAA